MSVALWFKTEGIATPASLALLLLPEFMEDAVGVPPPPAPVDGGGGVAKRTRVSRALICKGCQKPLLPHQARYYKQAYHEPCGKSWDKSRKYFSRTASEEDFRF